MRVLGSKFKKQGFPNIPNLQKIRNLFYSKLSKNYKKLQKITLKLNLGNCKKLVPTRKPTRMFGLKFGMQGLSYGNEVLSQ